MLATLQTPKHADWSPAQGSYRLACADPSTQQGIFWLFQVLGKGGGSLGHSGCRTRAAGAGGGRGASSLLSLNQSGPGFAGRM